VVAAFAGADPVEHVAGRAVRTCGAACSFPIGWPEQPDAFAALAGGEDSLVPMKTLPFP